MSNWVERITNLFQDKPEHAKTDRSVSKMTNRDESLESKIQALSANIYNPANPVVPPKDAMVAFTQDISNAIAYNTKTPRQFSAVEQQKPKAPVEQKHEVAKVAQFDGEDDGNVRALKKLREMPRGIGKDTDSRISAIKNMLGEKEIFKTLQMLRWPKGIVCPRCKSSKVVRRDPPPDVPDQRHYYECLNCKGEGRASDFDDFTGLPIGSLHGLRQWILCWYLLGFCSLSQISKALGLGIAEISQIIAMGSQITELAEGTELRKEVEAKDFQRKERKRSFFENRKESIFKQEEDTRSESKNIFKPGPKSKK